MHLFFLFFIRLPQEFPSASGLTERWCASTLGSALLIRSRAGSDLGHASRLVWGLCQLGSYISKSNSIYSEITIIGGAKSDHINVSPNMPQAGLNQGFDECLLEFDTCSNPLKHHGWIFLTFIFKFTWYGSCYYLFFSLSIWMCWSDSWIRQWKPKALSQFLRGSAIYTSQFWKEKYIQ